MTNVKLSKEESELVINADVILTKNRIISKVYDLFGELSEEYQNMGPLFPSEVLSIHPKISKGENYQGLPWVMLDHPRSFSNTDSFAVRSFFWWGHFFSCTLLLQGKYKDAYQLPIATYLKNNPEDWWICIAGDPWQHHFEENNFIPYSGDMDVAQLSFIKLAKKIPLHQWDNSFQFFARTFEQFGKMLSTQPVK